MRVISQHGGADFPYEQIVVRSEMEYVMAVYKEKEYVLGKYSSDEKAGKAMEMLRETYLKYMEIEGRADLTGQGIIQPNFWVLPKVFQFPQDDEIEV